MFSTVLLLGVFASLIALSLGLWGLCLWLGLRWVQAPNISLGRIALVTVVAWFISLGLNGLSLTASPATDTQARLLALFTVLAFVVMPCWMIAWTFQVSMFRSLQAWLPTLLQMALIYAVVSFVLRPFLFEAFASPSNAMAPTILGRHWQSACPDCGAANYTTPHEQHPWGEPSPREAVPMICSHFHIGNTVPADSTVHPADRIVVTKFLAPQRWDIIVFRDGDDPAILRALRLVGLPGEKITIAEGAVWADGVRLTPPADLTGIQYQTDQPVVTIPMYGTLRRPAVLGKGEHFVLGDFSAITSDSRVWQQGAAKLHPYAVPASHIVGTVTHIYWPPSRWRVLR